MGYNSQTVQISPTHHVRQVQRIEVTARNHVQSEQIIQVSPSKRVQYYNKIKILRLIYLNCLPAGQHIGSPIAIFFVRRVHFSFPPKRHEAQNAGTGQTQDTEISRHSQPRSDGMLSKVVE